MFLLDSMFHKCRHWRIHIPQSSKMLFLPVVRYPASLIHVRHFTSYTRYLIYHPSCFFRSRKNPHHSQWPSLCVWTQAGLPYRATPPWLSDFLAASGLQRFIVSWIAICAQCYLGMYYLGVCCLQRHSFSAHDKTVVAITSLWAMVWWDLTD